MRLLILTQAVDLDDPVLGFFHGWLREFAAHFKGVLVVCLKKGKYNLPDIEVHSLGKEEGRSRFARTLRFFAYAWKFRAEYDAVFVHMNQEYVLLGALLWKLLGKKVYLWRNHYAGTLLTRLAVALSDKVFCTSHYSYTARFKKAVLMPVGVDTAIFKPRGKAPHASILSLGRLAPSKRIEMLIEALAALKKKGVRVNADIYGDASEKDRMYRDQLIETAQESGLGAVKFHAAVSNRETVPLYQSHEIFVNTSKSGMYDKTIFEAAASGALVLAASRDFAGRVGDQFSFYDAGELAERIEKLVTMPSEKRMEAQKSLESFAKEHDLPTLGKRLAEEIR